MPASKPCLNCRRRHLKCDNQPECTRCTRKGIECVRSHNIRFRHNFNPSVPKRRDSGLSKGDYDYSSDQHWCKTPHRLHFINETRELVSNYEADEDVEEGFASVAEWNNSNDSPPEDAIPPPFTSAPAAPTPPVAGMSSIESPESRGYYGPSTRRRTGSQAGISDASFHPSPGGFITSPTSAPRVPQHGPISGTMEYLQSPDGNPASSIADFVELQRTDTHVSSISGAIASPTAARLTRMYMGGRLWPLQDKEEAMLMRYFVEALAPNLDLCDPDRHFALVVPHRAANSPILLNAIFACSATNLSRASGFDPYISDRYHQECLKHLIPMLSDSDAVMDENLLAATIILRYLEEVQVSIDMVETESHLLGAHAFIAAQESSAVVPGLRQAAIWVGLRQEMFIAYIMQRSILPALTHCNIDRSFEDAGDHVWANRMIVHCADVIRYCYGDGPANTTVYDHLVDYMDSWMALKPSTFEPMFYKDAGDGNCFPEIWLLGAAVVTALQHYHLARILLAAHNPNIPRLGPITRSALRRTDDEITSHVRIICGMALSNPDPPPNLVNASIAIACAGDRFTDRKEQEALLDILTKTQGVRAWPSEQTYTQLKEAWGWEDMSTSA